MTKFKHFETESGKTIMTAQFDGYDIADRMLEGLQFQITVQADGTLKAWVKPEDEDFFSDFNTTKFLKMAVEYAEGNDSFTDPVSGEECWLVPEGGSNATPINAPIPIVVQKVNPLAAIASNQPHSCGSGCNHNHTPTQTPSNSTYSIIDQILGSASQSSTETEEETKEPVIGKFKPKRKFLNFVIGKKGGIRFHTDTAFIKGEQLSGMLEGVVFKITICDEGTINFEETDTKECTDEMIQRFIDDIDSRDVTGYMQKYIVHNLDFYDGDAKRLYLEVEEQKPIDKLASLFDSFKEEETKKEEIMEEVKVSDSALSLLDSLFGDETTTETEVEAKEEKAPQETYAQQMMREAFEDMNREKIAELTERIEKKEKDISQSKQLIKQHESNLKSASEDYRVLQTRLESLKPADPANGYVFYVSPENKSGVVLDQALQDVVKQISPLLKLREDVVIDYLTKGFFTIKIAKKDNLTDENFSIEKEVYEKINKLDVTGKMSMVGNGEFEYRGEMTWHKLVDKMLKMGFEQEPEYDKLCGSPSYQSEEVSSISNGEEKIDDSSSIYGPFSDKPGVVVPNFVGKIEVTAFRERLGKPKTEFSNNFNLSDYIQHQFENVSVEVGILLPEGTQIIDLNEDCSIPNDILRDIKIDTIIK